MLGCGCRCLSLLSSVVQLVRPFLVPVQNRSWRSAQAHIFGCSKHQALSKYTRRCNILPPSFILVRSLCSHTSLMQNCSVFLSKWMWLGFMLCADIEHPSRIRQDVQDADRNRCVLIAASWCPNCPVIISSCFPVFVQPLHRPPCCFVDGQGAGHCPCYPCFSCRRSWDSSCTLSPPSNQGSTWILVWCLMLLFLLLVQFLEDCVCHTCNIIPYICCSWNAGLFGRPKSEEVVRKTVNHLYGSEEVVSQAGPKTQMLRRKRRQQMVSIKLGC